LEIWPCQAVCTWDDAGEELGGEPLFRCGGCGSEWVRSQPWTPAGADGLVCPAVAAQVALRGC